MRPEAHNLPDSAHPGPPPGTLAATQPDPAAPSHQDPTPAPLPKLHPTESLRLNTFLFKHNSNLSAAAADFGCLETDLWHFLNLPHIAEYRRGITAHIEGQECRHLLGQLRSDIAASDNHTERRRAITVFLSYNNQTLPRPRVHLARSPRPRSAATREPDLVSRTINVLSRTADVDSRGADIVSRGTDVASNIGASQSPLAQSNGLHDASTAARNATDTTARHPITAPAHPASTAKPIAGAAPAASSARAAAPSESTEAQLSTRDPSLDHGAARPSDHASPTREQSNPRQPDPAPAPPNPNDPETLLRRLAGHIAAAQPADFVDEVNTHRAPTFTIRAGHAERPAPKPFTLADLGPDLCTHILDKGIIAVVDHAEPDPTPHPVQNYRASPHPPGLDTFSASLKLASDRGVRTLTLTLARRFSTTGPTPWQILRIDTG